MVAFPFKNNSYTFWKPQEVACARQSAALELGSSSLETAFMYSKTLLILPIFNENHNQYMAASCKYAWNQTGEIWITAPSEILLKKWLSKRGEMGGRKTGEMGGREIEGRSGQTKFRKLFQSGRSWRFCITEANSVEFFGVDSFLAEKQTSKVKIPLF